MRDAVARTSASVHIRRSIEPHCHEYVVRNAGQFPDSLDKLVEPDANGYSYIETRVVPLDPWKNEYVYEAPTPGSGEPRAHLVSWGQDGQPGSADDIDNWHAGKP